MNKEQSVAGVRKLRELRGAPFDAERYLSVIAEVRELIPEHDRPSVPLLPPVEERFDFAPASTEEFEQMTVIDAAETLVAEVEYAYGRHLIRCVQELWALEDHPEQLAELRVEIAALRRHYQAFFGKPIPPNPRRK